MGSRSCLASHVESRVLIGSELNRTNIDGLTDNRGLQEEALLLSINDACFQKTCPKTSHTPIPLSTNSPPGPIPAPVGANSDSANVTAIAIGNPMPNTHNVSICSNRRPIRCRPTRGYRSWFSQPTHALTPWLMMSLLPEAIPLASTAWQSVRNPLLPAHNAASLFNDLQLCRSVLLVPRTKTETNRASIWILHRRRKPDRDSELQPLFLRISLSVATVAKVPPRRRTSASGRDGFSNPGS